MSRRFDPMHLGEGAVELINADCTRYYWRDWRRALAAYLAAPEDFYAAERFMALHPANQRDFAGTPMSWWHQNLDWMVVRVDPKTERIEDDRERNTATRVWVEWGPWAEDDPLLPAGIASHDPRVDTGAPTFERAIVNLAHNVWKLYGARPDVPNDAKLAKKDRW